MVTFVTVNMMVSTGLLHDIMPASTKCHSDAVGLKKQGGIKKMHSAVVDNNFKIPFSNIKKNVFSSFHAKTLISRGLCNLTSIKIIREVVTHKSFRRTYCILGDTPSNSTIIV
jgi:hypothetical protein